MLSKRVNLRRVVLYLSIPFFIFSGQYFSEYSGNMIDNGIFGNVFVQESRKLFIGQVRSYCKNVIYWSIALDENNGPKVSHTV